MRHEQAIDQMENYVALLRNTSLAAAFGPNGRPRRPFAFKLEFEDGRWDVGEKQLEATPRVGDVISFEGGGSWRVHTSEFVHTHPAQKPMRELFMCAPAA